MSAKSDREPGCQAQTLLGAGTVVAGHILFAGGLRVDGEVKGDVRSADGQPGTLIVGEKGCVEGNVDVARLIVNGRITGRVDAREFLKLQSGARLECDVDYAAAEIHPGAVVRGDLRHAPSRRDAEKDALPMLAECALAG